MPEFCRRCGRLPHLVPVVTHDKCYLCQKELTPSTGCRYCDDVIEEHSIDDGSGTCLLERMLQARIWLLATRVIRGVASKEELEEFKTKIFDELPREFAINSEFFL